MTDQLQAVLRDVWNWLPAFRAVAETEHLPSAAERLHVTPAAVSRTLGLLEDRLGENLFNRSGRSIVLNENGRALLEEVRTGMSSVERGLRRVTRQPMTGPVRVSSVGVLTNYFVTPALLELTREHENLKPVLRNLSTREAGRAVVRADVDVAFFYESMTFEELEVERIGETYSSIYCGRGHPLFDAEDPTFDELLEHPFSVPGLGDTGRVMDDWPTGIDREIGMQIRLLTTNLRVARSGRFLTVLPDVAARGPLEREELRRFPFEVLPPTDLYAAWRTTDDEEGTAAVVVEAVRDVIDETADELREVHEDFQEVSSPGLSSSE